MEFLAVLVAGVVIGAAVTVVVVRRGSPGTPAPHGDDAATAAPVADPTPLPTPVTFLLARRVLEVMRSGAIVVDPHDEVVLVNEAARAMGVLRDGRLVAGEVALLAGQTRRSQQSNIRVVDLPRGRPGRVPAAVSVHAAPLDSAGHVVVLLDDVTEARRLEAVRRDFVANVSHELKTPVGALTLLAEAVQDAADDPGAVRRFAGRMQHEGGRLGRLMKELIELSRVQGADPLPEQREVPVDRVVTEALDRTRLAAERAGIVVVSGGDQELVVRGDEPGLIVALVNLVANAIAYSATGTRVAVGVRYRPAEPDHGFAGIGGPHVEISVTDEGIGIAKDELERVFERFYRADPARSRATGGTGLGLAIVKHIASNHGGSVRVWSTVGSGSTFVLRLPAAPECRGSRHRDSTADAGSGTASGLGTAIAPVGRVPVGRPERES